jgi:hypothetical protein
MNEEMLSRMLEVAEHLHVTMVTSVHGDQGLPALRALLRAIKALYQRVAPEVHQGTIIIAKALNDSPLQIQGVQPQTVLSLPTLALPLPDRVIIQPRDNGTYLVWLSTTADPAQLASEAIVYSFHRGLEKFYAGDKVTEVIKLSTATVGSNFAIPTFYDLAAALERYALSMARHSSCKILQEVWFDNQRLFITTDPKPEAIMRDSLTQFLKSSLGTEAEVRPEQNTDESHPIDIKVEWFMSQKIALIEIKWLGISRDATERRSVWGQARARKGARQLADYLDKNKTQAPVHETRGYLVVFDARRRGLRLTTTAIEADKGLYFDKQELTFNPEFHVERFDFEVPSRFFLEPICHIPEASSE